MKKTIFLFILFVITACNIKSDNYKLEIIHTSDLHSHLFPFNVYGDCEIDDEICLGGFARITSLMKEKINKNPNVLIFDTGDRFSGTSYYTLTKGRYIIQSIAKMPYTAYTFGNHEFDEGTEEAEKFVQSMPFPAVASNLKFVSSDILKNKVKTSIILSKKGRKIGVIGVVTDEISPLGLQKSNITISDIAQSVQNEVNILKNKGIDIIILLSHIGIDEDIELANNIKDIDIIVGGHSHTLLSNDENVVSAYGNYPIIVENENKTLISATGMGGQYIGNLNVIFDKNGNIIKFSGDTIPVNSEIKNDRIVKDIILSARENLKEILNQKIATTNKDIAFTKDKDFCSQECEVGELITSVLLGAFPNVDAVMLNSGGIRSSFAKGDILYNNLAQVYPYDSKVIIAELTGNEIKNFVQHGISNFLPDERTNAMLQTAGIEYSFSQKTKKIISISMNGKKIEEDKIYRVLTNKYIAEGGDGFPQISNYIEIEESMRDIIRQQFHKIQHIDFIAEKRIKTID